jgi:hypothetical protein
MAYKVFTNGSVLNASEVNDNLMNQSVITFSNTTARTTAIPSPIDGMVTYLQDIDALQIYDGTAWRNVANTGRGVLSFQSATAATSIVANTELTLFTSTVTILPGRLYEFYGRVAYQAGGTSGPRALYINSSVLSNRTLFYETTGIGTNLNATMQGSGVFSSTAIGVTSGTGSSTTFFLRLKMGTSGSLNANPDGYIGAGSSEQQFIIRDIGAE